MKVGITGSNGFIGYHLWVHLKYLTKPIDNLEVIRLSRDLKEVSKCDLVVHLAEKNIGKIVSVVTLKNCDNKEFGLKMAMHGRIKNI
mgnify:CR=1 FL=1